VAVTLSSPVHSLFTGFVILRHQDKF